MLSALYRDGLNQNDPVRRPSDQGGAIKSAVRRWRPSVCYAADAPATQQSSSNGINGMNVPLMPHVHP